MNYTKEWVAEVYKARDEGFKAGLERASEYLRDLVPEEHAVTSPTSRALRMIFLDHAEKVLRLAKPVSGSATDDHP